MEELLTLPGVARKTANVVLGTAYGIASGVVVDTHVFRITHRLKLTKEKTPEKVEQDLMKLVPPRPLGFLQPSVDLVRQKNLRRAQPPLRRVPPGNPLRLSGQKGLSRFCVQGQFPERSFGKRSAGCCKVLPPG